MSTFRLQNRIKAILDLLREKNPVEVDELLLLQGVIAERAKAPDSPYAHVRTPSAAVTMLLAEIDQQLSKKQIYEELHKRGYLIDSSSKKGLVNDAINYLLETGDLVKHGRGTRGDAVVSLARKPKAPSQEHPY